MKKVVTVTVIYAWLFWLAIPVFAHDMEHPEFNEWYESLKQPDNPTTSCCGVADAYWADKLFVKDGKTYAVITDDRDDAMLGRPHVEIGTEIEVPDTKLKWDRGNPTGHAVIFLGGGGYGGSRYVFCFVQGGGV
jgi:hypothetical protein